MDVHDKGGPPVAFLARRHNIHVADCDQGDDKDVIILGEIWRDGERGYAYYALAGRITREISTDGATTECKFFLNESAASRDALTETELPPRDDILSCWAG